MYASDAELLLTEGQDAEDSLTHEEQKKEREAQKQEELITIVYERMFKKFIKELFKGCQKEN